jgi:hypothetical protein
MAIYHCSTKPLARSSGRSSVAAAAYRAGDCLTDERQGLEHDYTRRSGVLHSELVLPAGAGEWTRAELWNSAELAEKRKDGRTAREWEVALPAELGQNERRELAVRFAGELAGKYGCAVDVALHAPDREGDQRNFHAHLLATTRKVSSGAFAEKCDIELSDSNRLSRGLAPARIEIESVRQMWAEQVNRQLQEARSTERVDHRSLAAQREEAIQKNQPAKVVTLDRAPQVKLGWKVIQMERRSGASDRGKQLREVKAENAQRQAAVIDIGQLRDQLARRIEREATERRAGEQKKLIMKVEAAFHGLSQRAQQAVLDRWRAAAAQEIPQIESAREIWEKDPWAPDAKAWRETRNTIQWETEQVDKSAQAVEGWHREHPVRSLVLRTGLKQKRHDLKWLEQEYAKNVRFLAGNEKKLGQLERGWLKKRSEYEQQLERQAESIQEARQALKVIEENPQHFQKVFEREDQAWRQKLQAREQEDRRRQRGRGGWSR